MVFYTNQSELLEQDAETMTQGPPREDSLWRDNFGIWDSDSWKDSDL